MQKNFFNNAFIIFILFSLLFLFSCSVHQEKDVNDAKIVRIEEKIKNMKDNQWELEDQIQSKNKIIAELEKKVETLEQRVSKFENKAPAPQTLNKDKVTYTELSLLYEKARNLFLKNDFKNAKELFLQYINDYPVNDLTDNALYWAGECYYSLGSFNKAALTFKDVVTKYPKGSKVPDALLKTGFSYLSLKNKDKGVHYLKLVLKKYPFSDAAEKAQIKLNEFK